MNAIFYRYNGVYDKDPYKHKNAKKLDYISYENMEKWLRMALKSYMIGV